MNTIATLLLSSSILHAAAQGITGRIMDNNTNPLENAIVQVFQNGSLLAGNLQDTRNGFTVRSLDSGEYDVLFLYSGFDSLLLKRVLVVPSHLTSLWAHLPQADGVTKCKVEEYPAARRLQDAQEGQQALNGLETPALTGIQKMPEITYIVDVNIVYPSVPASGLRPYNFPGSYILTREEIEHMPALTVGEMVSIFPGIYQARRGDPISIYGSRMEGNSYIIDGIRQ